MDRMKRTRTGSALILAAALAAAPATAQQQADTAATATVTVGAADTVVITPGARYRAGGLHNLFFGRHYRDLWATPIRVERLDLDRFAGGLRPTRLGGGKQTHSLRFAGADGREYQFRSVDKDPSPLLPENLRRTVAQRIFQDQISAGHPAAPLVVSPILTAAGVLHSEPRLVVMPDSPALGEFRAEFGGLLGTIEERPTDEGPGFADASKIVSTEALFDRLEHHQDEHVDTRAFLAARLIDLLLGDWDRHQDQWRWARLGDGRSSPWTPIPRDRDQAFSRYDGLLLGLARLSAPQLVEFSATYPSTVGLTWNARVVDRRLLTGLDWPVWDSIATALQGTITDAVIDDAVHRMPPELRAKNEAWLAGALKHRRDALPEAAGRFYRLLAGEAEVFGSDKAERVTAARTEGRVLDLTVRAAEDDSVAPPLFHRRFDRADTKEVRLYLHGGDDVVQISGTAGGAPLLRVIGGGGDDKVVDSSTAGRARFYDARGTNAVEGTRRVPLDTRPYNDWQLTDSTPYPPRDWGGFWRFKPWLNVGPEVGLFFGGGLVRYDFGFRKRPYRSRMELRAGYATDAETFRVEFTGDFRRVNSRVRTNLLLRASGIEVVRFFGFGNETPRIDSDFFYRVPQQQYLIQPSVVFPVGHRATFSVGPTLKYADTDLDPGRFITLFPPFGVGGFGMVGASAALRVDGRDGEVAHRGVHLTAGGSVFPAVWDVDGTFGEVHGEVAAFLTPRTSFGPTLALRAGGKRVWGDYPFFEAAFVGGAATVRGLREDRYAGDASAYGNVELRVRLGRYFVLLPGDYGVFALADVGRVFLEGESSDVWHTGAGGGFWFAFLDPANTITVALARGDGRTALYLRAGFAY
jgi:hypothetical protein